MTSGAPERPARLDLANLIKKARAWVVADLKATPDIRVMTLALILGILVTIAAMGIAAHFGWLR